jgi:DNA repair photolyase
MKNVLPLRPPDPRLRAAPVKGRGTATRIAHRFTCTEKGREDDGWPGDADDDGLGGGVSTEVVLERARSILARNDSPDIPFTWSLNPYRGCEHGCIYCYARPTHSYLNLSPGLDFESKLVAKVNAAELLVSELQRPSHTCSPINIGSATDAWQPVEREWRITRGLLEVLDACRHPFTAVTKSAGIERDIDLLARAAERQQVYVMVSLTTLDADLCRKLEPRAAAPWRRLQTIRRLREAGVPVGVNVAPIIPFVNEPEIERLIDAAADAGACAIHYTIVRLPREVLPLFQGWLADHVPERAERVMARIREMRGGRDYDANFSLRMKGQGVWAELIRQRVRGAAARRGIGHAGPLLDVNGFDPARLAAPSPQGSLF